MNRFREKLKRVDFILHYKHNKNFFKDTNKVHQVQFSKTLILSPKMPRLHYFWQKITFFLKKWALSLS